MVFMDKVMGLNICGDVVDMCDCIVSVKIGYGVWEVKIGVGWL